MIDLKYYLKFLQKEESELIFKLFENRKFKSLSSAAWFFKDKAPNELEWMKKDEAKAKLIESFKKFVKVLEDEQLSLVDKIELVLKELDLNSPQLDFLDIKGSNGSRSVTCVCPKCKGFGSGKSKAERAWIPKNGTAKSVICNHRSSCGFNKDFIGAYAEEYDITYGKALFILADELNVDFTSDEVHTGNKIVTPIKQVVLTPKVIKEQKIEYIAFSPQKAYAEIDLESFINKFDTMTEEQQFKMIATSIYRFSLNTKQWGKENYFKSVGISKKNPILKEKINMIETYLGYLFKTDIQNLVEHLKKLFSTEILVKYGVLDEVKHTFKQSIEEGLIVIPNFDMYSNMCTGLKYRKTKLKSWIDKDNLLVVDKNKEPEFSYGRIANPLPYHLTRDALLDKSITFRFFEGQKDLHSMPFKVGVCDIAIPGVNGISEEMLGLFKGRIVELYFDQDKAGQEGAMKLKAYLEKAEAIVINKTWDLSLGADINEVLQNNKIQYIK